MTLAEFLKVAEVRKALLKFIYLRLQRRKCDFGSQSPAHFSRSRVCASRHEADVSTFMLRVRSTRHLLQNRVSRRLPRLQAWVQVKITWRVLKPYQSLSPNYIRISLGIEPENLSFLSLPSIMDGLWQMISTSILGTSSVLFSTLTAY